LKDNQMNSDEELHHSNIYDMLVRSGIQGDDSLSFFLGIIEKISCLKATLLEGSQKMMQQLKPHLNQGAHLSMRIGVIYILFAPGEVNSNPTTMSRRTRH
jgi:hypothetical protein